MKRRRAILALVVLLIMSHFFIGWSKENVWIFLVDVLILILIFLREYLWDFGVWVYGRHHVSIDNVILKSLTSHEGYRRTVEEIVADTRVKRKTVEASLERLREKHDADCNAVGEWRKVDY